MGLDLETGHTHLSSEPSFHRAPPTHTKHTPNDVNLLLSTHISIPSFGICSSLITLTPLHSSPQVLLKLLFTRVDDYTETPIQQTLVHPLDLKYARGTTDFREVKRMGKCRVRTKTELKVYFWVLPYSHTWYCFTYGN